MVTMKLGIQCACTCCRSDDWQPEGDGWYQCAGCGCRAKIVPAR